MAGCADSLNLRFLVLLKLFVRTHCLLRDNRFSGIVLRGKSQGRFADAISADLRALPLEDLVSRSFEIRWVLHFCII